MLFVDNFLGHLYSSVKFTSFRLLFTLSFHYIIHILTSFNTPKYTLVVFNMFKVFVGII